MSCFREDWVRDQAQTELSCSDHLLLSQPGIIGDNESEDIGPVTMLDDSISFLKVILLIRIMK